MFLDMTRPAPGRFEEPDGWEHDMGDPERRKGRVLKVPPPHARLPTAWNPFVGFL